MSRYLSQSKSIDLVDMTADDDDDDMSYEKMNHVSSLSTINTSTSSTTTANTPILVSSSSSSNVSSSSSSSATATGNTSANEEYKASLTEKEEKRSTTTSRFGRTLKSTLVKIGGYDVLATNNYIVKGTEYIYGDNSNTSVKTPLKTGARKPNKNKDEKSQKKPRIRSAAEEKRILRVKLLKKRINIMDESRDNYLCDYIPILNSFLDKKVSRHLKEVKISKESCGKKTATSCSIFMQPDDVIAEMRDYQLEGLNWMMGMHKKGLGMILGDEMGLGKTLQTISLFCQLKQSHKRDGPSLVICPLSVLYSWCNELDKFAPSLKYLRLHSSCVKERDFIIKDLKENIWNYDVIITTYEMAKSPSLKHFWSSTYFNYVVLDEGHIIKNRQAQISDAVRRLHYENVLILTGTPLQNNLDELWAILNYIAPTVFTICEPFSEAFDLNRNIIHKDKLLNVNEILSMFMLRRLKVEVEKLLPAKVETQVLCPLSKVQHTIYKSLLMKDISTIINMQEGNSGASAYKQLMNLFMQLRKCCNHPYLFNGVEKDIDATSMMDLISASGKLSVLDLLLRSLFLKKNRVVLFSQFTSMLDIIDDYCRMRGWNFCRFDGSTPRAKRNLIINDFNAPNSSVFIFLMSTRSGSMGLNLQTADTCILFDSDWNPQCDVQAMARVHRIGQKKVVHVYRLVTGKTTEQRMVERAQKKLYLDKVVNVSSAVSGAVDTTSDGSGLTTKDIIADLKFGCDAIFGSDVHCLPTSEDVEIITNRNRTDNTSIGNLKGGISVKVSSFDTTTSLTDAHASFEGIDFRKIRNEKVKKNQRKSCGLADDDGWEHMGKRQSNSRISMVQGKGSGYGAAAVPVLKSNNYELETGEVSVFDRELAGRVKPRENYAVLKNKQEVINHQHFCQFCGYGGDLIPCSRCPVAVHAKCAGIRADKTNKLWSCSHHRCSLCSKPLAGAGGVLFPCQSCPNSYCEDCLPEDLHRRLGECPRFEDLGFDSTKSFSYIHCSAQCEHVAINDFGWRPEQKKVFSCPEPLDLAEAFH